MDSSGSRIDFVNTLDDRVVQHKSIQYPIIRSNGSVICSKIDATTAQQSQLTFRTPNIGPGYDIDGVARITGWLYFDCTMTTTAQILTAAVGNAAIVPGVNLAPASLPFNQGVASATVIVNDVQPYKPMAIGEIKDLLQRLYDYKGNADLQTGPSCADMLTKYDDGYLSSLNPLSNINDIDPMSGFVGNGTWKIEVCTYGANPVAWTSGALTWQNLAGQAPGAAADIPSGTVLNFRARIYFDEAVLSPPFLPNLKDEFRKPALAGVKSIFLQYVMNDGSRCLRFVGGVTTSAGGNPVPTFKFSTAAGGMFAPDTVKPQFIYNQIARPLSNALEEPLRPMYPFMAVDKEQYQDTGLQSGLAYARQYQTQQINLTRVPDLIAIGVKPKTLPSNYADFWYALNGAVSGPLNLTWCGTPGKCSTLTKKQLYAITRNNGLDMPYLLWSGEPITKYSGGAVSSVSGCGGVILVRPGIDFDIGIDSAPSSVGQFSLQVSISVFNQSDLNQQVGGANASNVEVYAFPIYHNIFEIDAVTSAGETKTGFVNASTVLEVDQSASVKSLSHVVDDLSIGGSLYDKMMKAHKGTSSYVKQGGKITGGAMDSQAGSGGTALPPMVRPRVRKM